ncbi:MAG: YafY family protein [Candidatus Dormiibacterota bacterium]
MVGTSARLLRLLSLLQTRREWPGPELADRLEVDTRTVRRDIDRLRSLGYPVRARPGAAGGYQLEAGTAMPPLLLDDEEAVAVAVGLRTAAGTSIAGIAETSVRALAKLQQVLPARLRQRVSVLERYTVPIPSRGPTVDPELLALLAGVCRDHLRLRFAYTGHAGAGSTRVVEPNRLVSWGPRWYLLAWDVDRRDWRTFRVDRLRAQLPAGPQFLPRDSPAEDVAAWVAERLGTRMWPVQARLRVHAPIEKVRDRMSGIFEPIDEETTLATIGGTNLDVLALYVGLFDADFEIVEPPELRRIVARLGARYRRAGEDASVSPG